MTASWYRPKWLCWPTWMAKAKPHSEVRAMLAEARDLQSQLETTREGLASFMARAERVADLLETRGDPTDEL